MNGYVELDLPWHMIIESVSHELGFAGRDVYDLIIEAEKDTGYVQVERDLTPHDLLLEQA